jgi:hypothetical protein
LKAQPRRIQQRPQRGRREHRDLLFGQMPAELVDRPPGQRHALRVGTGARDGHHGVALLGRDLPWAPAPVVRVKRPETTLVEVVDDLADMIGVGQIQPRDLRRRHLGRRGQQDHRPDARRAMLAIGRQPLEPTRLDGLQRPHKHFGRTHPHLHRSDASPFDASAPFPVQRFSEAH